MAKLEINKTANEKVINIVYKNTQYTLSADFSAYCNKNIVALTSKLNDLRFEAKVNELLVNGIIYNTGEEAVNDLATWVGLAFKSGGGSPLETPTLDDVCKKGNTTNIIKVNNIETENGNAKIGTSIRAFQEQYVNNIRNITSASSIGTASRPYMNNYLTNLFSSKLYLDNIDYTEDIKKIQVLEYDENTQVLNCISKSGNKIIIDIPDIIRKYLEDNK